MNFTDKLSALLAKATEGPWQVLEDYEGKRRGFQCGRDGGIFFHRFMYRGVANAELIAYLRNHAQEIVNLVDVATATLNEQRREFARGDIADLDDLEDALAALNKE